MIQPISRLFSKATMSMPHSFIRQILKLTKGVEGVISFAGGLPNPESFPKELLADIFCQVVNQEGEDVLQYGASEGDTILMEALKQMEGIPGLPHAQLIITTGSTSGIYFFTRTLINPGDIIISEAPGFPGSLAAMEACGARIVGVEMDESGMLPDRLKETLKSLSDKNEPIKFIYVIPEFQNPSGRTMDIRRRRGIIGVAKEFDLPILEDQPYRELRYDGEPLTTMWELAKNEYNDPELVTICKSFSKILGPGMRLGYTMGPPDVVGQMVKWAQKITVSPDCTTQRVAARFIEKGHMNGHIEKIIDLYRPRRDAMLNALEAHMPANVKWTHPEGGMFIWVTFPDEVDTDAILVRAVENKVAFIPGSKFYTGGTVKKNELRLNFSYTSIDLIEEGIKRLSALL